MKVAMDGDPTPFEVTEELLEAEILPRLLTFSTTLFASPKRSDPNMTYCGSATFVRAKGRSCLLTAQHVWRRVQRKGPCVLMGLDHSAMPSREHPLAVEDLDYMGPPLYISTPRSEPWGPDLALIAVPDLHADVARVAKAFYDIDRRRADALASKVAHETGLWAMIGAPGEHSSVESGTRVMRTYCFGSTITQATSRDDFDYLDVAIRASMTPSLASYGGLSGAGLWRCTLSRSPSGAVECAQYALEGIAFFEELDRETHQGFIRCHGRSSIYGQALA